MIYTEYFVRGTQPDTECPLHRVGFGERLAGIFGKDVGTPVSVDDAGLPPPTASTSGTPATVTPGGASATVTAEKVEEPKKKRGFWGRIFGRGDDEENKKEEERKKQEEERKKAEERRRRGGG
jgi:hypothetical protein